MCGVSFAPAGVATVTVMLSYLHEGLVELFRYRPALTPTLLTDLLGVSVPSFDEARVASSDLTNLVPTEYRADAVITLTLGDAPVLGLVVEVQLRDDPQKRWAWPAYVVNLYARLRCPVLLAGDEPRSGGRSVVRHPDRGGRPRHHAETAGPRAGKRAGGHRPRPG